MGAEARPTQQRTRWAVTAGVALISVGLLAFNASATFTAQVAPTHDTDTGDMELTLPGAGANHRIATSSADLVPGDKVHRTMQITVDDEGDTLAGVTLSTSGSGSPTFVTDTTNGLELAIARCSQAWTESGTSPAFTYSCGGTETEVLGDASADTYVDFVQNAVDISAGLDLNDNAVNYLMVEMRLPSSAPDSMESQSSTLTFQFDGTQRSATNK